MNLELWETVLLNTVNKQFRIHFWFWSGYNEPIMQIGLKERIKINNDFFPPASPIHHCYKVTGNILNSAGFFVAPILCFPYSNLTISSFTTVAHLCTVMHCTFKDKASIYIRILFVCMSSCYSFCCSHGLIYSVPCCTGVVFKGLFIVGIRLSPQYWIQQSIHSFVSDTLLRVSLLKCITPASPKT